MERESRERAQRDLGVQFESAVARRERLADNYDIEFGSERVFPELVKALLEEVPQGKDLLEVGAATGLLTKPLLDHAASVTAMEPSHGLLRRLLASDVADSPKLKTLQGVVEDLPEQVAYDVAVVTFTPRRGYALVRLLHELAQRVADRVIVMLSADGSLDWAYLARTAVSLGFETRVRLVPHEGGKAPGAIVDVRVSSRKAPFGRPDDAWSVDAREVRVPYPPPRGAATRLVRYFLSGGDSALTLDTDPRGVERLYGNLRTAVHRIGRDELTVRRQGEVIQLVRLPKPEPYGRDDEAPFV